MELVTVQLCIETNDHLNVRLCSLKHDKKTKKDLMVTT